MYEITKEVPIPEPKVRHNYPYEAMQVGESFWVAGISLQPCATATGVGARGWSAGLYAGGRVRA
jgi:hypothetical protein